MRCFCFPKIFSAALLHLARNTTANNTKSWIGYANKDLVTLELVIHHKVSAFGHIHSFLDTSISLSPLGNW